MEGSKKEEKAGTSTTSIKKNKLRVCSSWRGWCCDSPAVACRGHHARRRWSLFGMLPAGEKK